MDSSIVAVNGRSKVAVWLSEPIRDGKESGVVCGIVVVE